MIDATIRIRHRIPLSLVAKFYRGGVTRERIRQIESGIVSRKIERAYKEALKTAVSATYGKAVRPNARRRRTRGLVRDKQLSVELARSEVQGESPTVKP